MNIVRVKTSPTTIFLFPDDCYRADLCSSTAEGRVKLSLKYGRLANLAKSSNVYWMTKGFSHLGHPKFGEKLRSSQNSELQDPSSPVMRHVADVFGCLAHLRATSFPLK